MNEGIRATYVLDVEADRAEERGRTVALEQTVELPEERVPWTELAGRVEPEIGAVEQIAADRCRVEVIYPAGVVGEEPAQLLNVLFGNVSLQPDVALTDLELPSSLRETLGGPAHGIAGLRERTGRTAGALTCTALKPMGLSPSRLADRAGTFARAGIDLVKDDHGLADPTFCPFEERVGRCREAVQAANRSTGRSARYVPHVTGTPAQMERRLAYARSHGIDTVLYAPMLAGLPAAWEVRRAHPDVAFLAHPAFAGAPRFSETALLGTLFRAMGADGVIFPHASGRFDVDPDRCRRLAERLRAPVEEWAPALPVPAGGIAVESAEEAVAFYGPEVALLVGGSLYGARDRLEERARTFVARTRESSS